jgi:hypothetical protein
MRCVFRWLCIAPDIKFRKSAADPFISCPSFCRRRRGTVITKKISPGQDFDVVDKTMLPITPDCNAILAFLLQLDIEDHNT